VASHGVMRGQRTRTDCEKEADEIDAWYLRHAAGQSSVVSGHWSLVNGQWSVISDQ